MAKLDPFYMREITPETIDLFVNREAELEDVISMLSGEEYAAVPVFGDVGTGKTSFLNVVKHRLEEEGVRVMMVTAEDIFKERITNRGEYVRRNGYTRSGEPIDVLLVDDIEKLDEKEAYDAYRKLLGMSKDVNIAFTGREDWGKDVMKIIDWLSTGGDVYLELRPEDMAYFLGERFKRLGIENRFDRDALLLTAERAKNNLRYFFRYCSRAYHLQKEGKITVDVMKDTILEIDLKQIARMEDMERNILRLLISQGEMTNQELMNSLKKMMSYKDLNYYKARNFLESVGFIRIRTEGRNAYISDIYHALQIDILEKMLDNPQFYARTIRGKYATHMRQEEKESELMFSSAG